MGRTGSGKSSLILNLLRLVELDSELGTSGVVKPKVMIDGQDISQIGLKHLRKAITLIPQDPFLL